MKQRDNIRVLVTGGSGFIGTNLIEDLMNKGIAVCNVDIVIPKVKNHKKVWRNVDIRNYEELQNVFIEFQPDYVIHLAARTDLEGKTIEDYDSNTLGTFNILKCCEGINRIKKMILTSSMLVCRTGYQPKNQFDYQPSTLYGESKVITEKVTWENEPKCDWAIIRPTSIWGPWFDVPYRNFFDMVIKKSYFHIGNKSCTKTYGYVGNAVYQIEELLWNSTEDKDNKIFYIGDYEPTNIEEWANEIAEQLNYKIVKVPFGIIKCAAWVGDLLKVLGIKFPMTSFRLKNMTTDNIVELENTRRIVGMLPYQRKEGIRFTLEWMHEV